MTAWSGWAMVAAAIKSGAGLEGLVIKLRSHAHAIGTHRRYPPKYIAASPMPVGIRSTAGLVSKLKNKYWLPLRATSIERKTSRKEAGLCSRSVRMKDT